MNSPAYDLFENLSECLEQSSQNLSSVSRSLQLRYWCFTLNNPTDEEIESLQSLSSLNTDVTYLVFQLERGENNTMHIQGYVEFQRSIRLNKVKIMISRRCHLERRMGTALQASNYCKKEATRHLGPWEYGEISTVSPGRRNDLNDIKQKIDAGASERTLWNEHFGTMCRYHRGISMYKVLTLTPRNFKTNVFIYWGQPGTGKSKHAAENYPDAYWKPRGSWWDGYNGQESVIIDDFYGWLPFDTLLRLMDRYPLLVEVKGTYVHFVSKNLVITSNLCMGEWYKNTNLDFNALKRRVEFFYLFNNTINIFTVYEDMFP